MSSIPRWEAASISITSSDVPVAIVTQALQTLSGVGVGPCAQLSAFARMRAIDVLPVPRGPANRYACRTWSAAIAFVSVRTTAFLPDHLVEVLRPVLTVERGHRTFRAARESSTGEGRAVIVVRVPLPGCVVWVGIVLLECGLA